MKASVVVFLVVVVFLQCSCINVDALGRGRYKVIERTDDPNCSSDHLNCTVKVVLSHYGHRFYATALDYKGDIDGATRYCNLHVGETVSCKFFQNRHSEDAGGYDLICGDQLWHGRLTTTGGNELLTIYKDQLR